MLHTSTVADRAKQVRAFNRFYTGQLELLNERLHHSNFTLTETRVLFELAARSRVVASDLVRDLKLDAGYLSRILAKFTEQGLVERTPTAHDARQMELGLTAKGFAVFTPLDKAAHAQIIEYLEPLTEQKQQVLVNAMSSIRMLFEQPSTKPDHATLRDLAPGDIGWITHRQARLYYEEYGWDLRYEALVAQILGEFGEKRDETECAWIAELDGRIVGSIFLMKATNELAKLRLLYVEPDTRGLGLGSQLVDACLNGARERGYKRMTLWTQSILTGARHIYAKAGFEKVSEEAHHSFGHDLIGETWEIDL